MIEAEKKKVNTATQSSWASDNFCFVPTNRANTLQSPAFSVHVVAITSGILR
jgi:hypothetical protein